MGLLSWLFGRAEKKPEYPASRGVMQFHGFEKIYVAVWVVWPDGKPAASDDLNKHILNTHVAVVTIEYAQTHQHGVFKSGVFTPGTSTTTMWMRCSVTTDELKDFNKLIARMNLDRLAPTRIWEQWSDYGVCPTTGARFVVAAIPVEGKNERFVVAGSRSVVCAPKG